MIYPVFLGCLSATEQLASPGLFLDLILGMIEPVKPTLTIKDDISNGGVHPMLQLHVALPSGHGRSFVLQSSKVGELKNLAKSTGCSFRLVTSGHILADEPLQDAGLHGDQLTAACQVKVAAKPLPCGVVGLGSSHGAMESLVGTALR